MGMVPGKGRGLGGQGLEKFKEIKNLKIIFSILFFS